MEQNVQSRVQEIAVENGMLDEDTRDNRDSGTKGGKYKMISNTWRISILISSLGST